MLYCVLIGDNGMQTILEVKNLKKTFYKNKQPYPVVNNIDFHLAKGECLGLVGESGSGKSTTAKLITRLIDSDSGTILLDGKEIMGIKGKALKEIYQNIQMIFQSPEESFDPRCSLGDGIMEGLRNQGIKRKEAQLKMSELLDMVELDREYAARYPHQVSGGQCQRAAIARALAVSPQLLICDEATSALDVTVQAQIIDLLQKLKKERSLSILLICHDLALVQKMCDRVLVMCQGTIIEQGTPDQIIKAPQERYTKKLIDSVF